MARINIQERMNQAIDVLRRSCWGPSGLDIERECKDEWSHDYAIIVVHISEPDDDEIRASFDADRLHSLILGKVGETFGRSAALVGKRGSVPHEAGRLILQLHPNDSFQIEIEAYRQKSTPIAISAP